MSKIALITGANKGIGLETARQLARDHGFTVLLGARDEERGQSAADELKAQGLDVQFLLIDPTDAASIERARAEVEERFGHLDALINNAGTVVQEDTLAPASVPTSAMRETFEINVFAVQEITRAFWSLLERSDAARIVNVSSIGGSLATQAAFGGPIDHFKFISYASSKAALNMMTIHYAWQWRDTKHKANTIHPGSVKTDLNKTGNLTAEEGAKTSVELATIGSDGPNGKFFHLGQELPW